MGNLDKDTAVSPADDGGFTAILNPQWAVWGPNGGYLAAVALRAAGAATTMRRPASIHCHFLRTPAFGPVLLRVQSQVRSRRAESLTVQLVQRGRVAVSATVWATDTRPDAPSRTWGRPPRVPAPGELRRLDEMVAEEGGPVLPLWQTCCEIRLAGWGGPERPAGDPRVFGWLRFVEPLPCGEDPWLDACRSLFGTDTIQFPAIGQGFAAREMTFIAPSLELYASFHAETCADEWLLVQGEGLAADGGLLGGRANVWSPDGRLLASGAQQMLIR